MDINSLSVGGVSINDLNQSGIGGAVGDMQSMTESMTQSVDDGSFMWGVLFGIVGMSFSMYGKKSDKDMFLYSGVALMAYPYFISGLKETILAGVLLTAIPFVVKR
jgi:hypothetical protein